MICSGEDSRSERPKRSPAVQTQSSSRRVLARQHPPECPHQGTRRVKPSTLSPGLLQSKQSLPGLLNSMQSKALTGGISYPSYVTSLVTFRCSSRKVLAVHREMMRSTSGSSTTSWPVRWKWSEGGRRRSLALPPYLNTTKTSSSIRLSWSSLFYDSHTGRAQNDLHSLFY